MLRMLLPVFRRVIVMKPLCLAIVLLCAASAMPASASPGADRAADVTEARHRAADARYWQHATTNLRLAAGAAMAPALATATRVTIDGLAQQPGPAINTVRKSITALSPAELVSLRRGIAQMIAWNRAPRGSADFKRSLLYWANMHSFVGPTDTPPIVCSPKSGLTYPGMAGLTTQLPNSIDERATWCTCEHGTIQFLTWHRMYLYYFEQVLAAAAGDPNVRLPFWDYETDGHIPTAYRVATYVAAGGATVANPLYVASRQAQLANGSQALSASVTSVSLAMRQTSYAPFDTALEQTPHGAVHCATGVASCPSGYMGYVPTAGNDPIFYSHHANLDRLYECWLRIAPAARLPNDPGQLARQFNFIAGNGDLVQRRVGDMLTTAQLNYSYSGGGGCPSPLLRTAAIESLRPMRSIPLTGPVSLKRGTTTIPLRIAPDARLSLLAFNAPATTGQRATLVIEGLTFDDIPRTLYAVYLRGTGGRRALVGVINFFNATAPHHDAPSDASHEAMPGMADHAEPSETRLDATEALTVLGSAANAQLIIEPTTGLTGSVVAEASKRITAKTNVRFSAARIDVE